MGNESKPATIEKLSYAENLPGNFMRVAVCEYRVELKTFPADIRFSCRQRYTCLIVNLLPLRLGLRGFFKNVIVTERLLVTENVRRTKDWSKSCRFE